MSCIIPIQCWNTNISTNGGRLGGRLRWGSGGEAGDCSRQEPVQQLSVERGARRSARCGTSPNVKTIKKQRDQTHGVMQSNTGSERIQKYTTNANPQGSHPRTSRPYYIYIYIYTHTCITIRTSFWNPKCINIGPIPKKTAIGPRKQKHRYSTGPTTWYKPSGCNNSCFIFVGLLLVILLLLF